MLYSSAYGLAFELTVKQQKKIICTSFIYSVENTILSGRFFIPDQTENERFHFRTSKRKIRAFKFTLSTDAFNNKLTSKDIKGYYV